MVKKRVFLSFNPQLVKEPITYNVIKKFDVIINIIQAKVFPEVEGQLIMEFEHQEEEQLRRALEYIKSQGVNTRVLDETIVCDEDQCISCGACTGVCRAGALKLDPGSYALVVDQDKCLLCELCISVCPVHALSLPKW